MCVGEGDSEQAQRLADWLRLWGAMTPPACGIKQVGPMSWSLENVEYLCWAVRGPRRLWELLRDMEVPHLALNTQR